MNFNDFLNKQLKQIKGILSSKEEEYAQGKDRLYNFTQAAHLQQIEPEQALLGMMTKHIVSVVDLLKEPEKATPYLIDEKLTDLQNYALLAQYMLHERIANTKTTIVVVPKEQLIGESVNDTKQSMFKREVSSIVQSNRVDGSNLHGLCVEDM